MTTAYDNQADAFGRQVQWLVEIDLDRCSLSYTTAPCTASDLGDGSRCYYSFGTCQDAANYTRTTKTWRFCLNEVPWPDTAYQVWPLLKSMTPVPQRIDPSRLLTYPERINVEMLFDYSPPPFDSDKTLHNTARSGEFWRNLLARNRNYVGRPLRIKRGFNASGFTLADFAQVGPQYVIRQISVDSNGVTISAESPLVELEKRQCPWTISDDNTIQDAGGINAAVTSITVVDASEYPDPAAYSRFNIYVECESEIMELTNRNTSTNVLTVTRGRLGTTAATHAADKKVSHVAFFGTDNGASAPSARNVIEVVRDLLHWADIADADINTTSFDDVIAGPWPDLDTLATIRKPSKIASLLQPIRENRGLLLYLDSTGKWALKVMAPDATADTIDGDSIVMDSVSVSEDDEDRITRCEFYYDPTTGKEQSRSVEDYQKAVIVIDTDLENVNSFGDVKSRTYLDAWLDPAASIAVVRNIARRLITRLRNGARVVTLQLELKDAALNVGDDRVVKSRLILGVDGAEESRACVVVAKREVGSARVEYELADTNYNGRYLRIGPDTMTDDYDDATTDRAYGYWGDANNRVGNRKELGYVFF